MRGDRVRQLAGGSVVASDLSPPERAIVVVWTGLNRPNSEERKAIYRFVTQQKRSGVDALQVRAFLDGLRFHFLKTRAKVGVVCIFFFLLLLSASFRSLKETILNLGINMKLL